MTFIDSKSLKIDKISLKSSCHKDFWNNLIKFPVVVSRDSVSFTSQSTVKLRHVDHVLDFLEKNLAPLVQKAQKKSPIKKDMRSREDVKVLHLLARTTTSGATLGVMNTVKWLKKLGYKVYFGGSTNGNHNKLADIAHKYADKVYNIPELEANELTKEAANAIDKVIKEVKPDIVHTHYSVAGTLGRYLAAKNDVPVIFNTYQQFPWHDHMPKEQKNKLVKLEKLLKRISTQLVTLSKNNREELVKLGITPKRKVVLAPAGNDFSKLEVTIDKNLKKQELGLHHLDYPVIGAVSRLTEQKNIETLIKAAQHVLEKTNAYFVIAADGHLRPKLEAMAQKVEEQTGKKGMIKFLGFRYDIPEIMKTFDMFALPSIFEAYAMVLTEAAYNKLPIIASKVDGIPFTVKHNKNGFLLSPKDDKAFAEKILDLIQDKKLRQKMGENGYKLVYPKRSIQEATKEIDKAYIKALKKKFGRSHVKVQETHAKKVLRTQTNPV